MKSWECFCQKIRDDKIWHGIILLAFVATYIIIVSRWCWTLPAPSDPCQYISPVVWKSTWAYFPWIDRLMMPIGINFISTFFSKAYVAGMVYIGIVNLLILILGMAYCYKKAGPIAGFSAAILLISSYLMTGHATYVYPTQTEALYSLIAFIFFFSKERKFLKPALIAGLFSALTFFTKSTGIATVLFFIAYLIFHKKWRNLTLFIYGGIIGTILVFSLGYIFFGYHSMQNVLCQTYRNLISNIDPRGPNTNLVSYLDLFVSKHYLPVFISLFIFVGAYRTKHSRRLYLMSIFHISLLYFIYTFTSRGGSLIDNYVYTAFIFSTLGMSVYLGSIFNSGGFACKFFNKADMNNKPILVAGLLGLIFLIAGFMIGYNNRPTGAFDIKSLVYLPQAMRWLYTLGPLVIVSMLACVEYSKLKISVVLLMIFASFWGSAYSGVLGIEKAKADMREAEFFYKAAHTLNSVPAKKFSIYVEDWNRRNHTKRVLWIYRLFFDNKYKRIFEPWYKSQYRNEYEIMRNIDFLNAEGEIINIKKNQILTDRPDIVTFYFPLAKEVVTIPWNEKQLSVLDIYEKGESQKYIKELFSESSLLKNYSFQNRLNDLNNNVEYWDAYGVESIEKEDIIKMVGEHSLKIKGDNYNFEQTLIDIKYYIGKPLTCFVLLRTDIKNKYRVQLYDGVTSTFSARHSGNGDWEILAATHTLHPSAKFFTVRVIQAAKTNNMNDIIYLNGVVLFEGQWGSVTSYLMNKSKNKT
jgi:hypothetical protein